MAPHLIILIGFAVVGWGLVIALAIALARTAARYDAALPPVGSAPGDRRHVHGRNIAETEQAVSQNKDQNKW